MNAIVPRWCNKALGVINQVLLCPFICSRNLMSWRRFEPALLMAAAPNCLIEDKAWQKLPLSPHKYSDQQLLFLPGTLSVLCMHSSLQLQALSLLHDRETYKSFGKRNMGLGVQTLGWRNPGQGEHSTCKCGSQSIFLFSRPFFLVVFHDI